MEEEPDPQVEQFDPKKKNAGWNLLKTLSLLTALTKLIAAVKDLFR